VGPAGGPLARGRKVAACRDQSMPPLHAREGRPPPAIVYRGQL
jgi:hypothetical protein